MSWVKHEGMCSEESVICDGSFEGSVIVHLVRNNIIVESEIRYGFLNSCLVLCIFVMVMVMVIVRIFVINMRSTASVRVRVRVRVRVYICTYNQCWGF